MTPRQGAIKAPSNPSSKACSRALSSGYTRNLKLLYAHFPITIEVKGSDVMVKNFLGEKQARKTVLIGTTKVLAKGQSVTVSGPDKEAVGQTIANLQDRDAHQGQGRPRLPGRNLRGRGLRG